MELHIKPHGTNKNPVKGFMIRGSSVRVWLYELQELKLSLENILIYPLPGMKANTISGCFVIPSSLPEGVKSGKHELFQKVTENLFIVEKSILFPPLHNREINNLFPNSTCIMHPDTGLVELKEIFDFSSIIENPDVASASIIQPEPSVWIPNKIQSFQVIPIEKEDLVVLMESRFPQREKLPDDSLSIPEKIKLHVYRLFFNKNKSGKKMQDSKSLWISRMQEDYENLEERNRKQVEKLLDLLKKNPHEALKYAIPLDEHGTSRGISNGTFQLSRRWNNLNLFGNNSGRGQGSIDLGTHVYTLREQYRQTAITLTNEGSYYEAAFIYLKLIKDYYEAAKTLEKGGFYQEAAMIYLKNLQNKHQAAECYERGNMLNEAIKLYAELENYEKAGDLCIVLNKKKEADFYYQKTVDHYKVKKQFIKASKIYKDKMQNINYCQAILLEGWKNLIEPVGCLSHYFSNIPVKNDFLNEFKRIYSQELNADNTVLFLHVIKSEYGKRPDVAEFIRNTAYEIISGQIEKNPEIVMELKSFNKTDKVISDDLIKFRLNQT